MNSEEALERIKRSHRIAMACLGIDKPDIETEKAIEKIEKELEVLEILKTRVFDEMKCFDLNEGWYDDIFYLNENEVKIIKEWLKDDKSI